MNGKSVNLVIQIDKLFKLNNMKSIKTRRRYQEACNRFCVWLGENTNIKKYKNIKSKHIYLYVDYMKSDNYAATTIVIELSAIRFFYNLTDGKEILPENKKLNLQKRVTRGARRAWSSEEIDKAVALAKEMNRIDVVKAILLSSTFGCRLEEAVVLTTYQIKQAICSPFLYLENTKGKYPREVPVKSENREILRYILANAKSPERIFIGIGDQTHKIKKNIQNWIINHREEFQNTDRIDRNVAREMLQEDRKSKPKVKLTMHGNRHTYAQTSFLEAIEDNNNDINAAKRKTSSDLGHKRVEVVNVYI
ncbi:site-specific integrase [Clostridium sp.]|uniref:tyrosine-type recombinase/integrase n=1 Tax=Clostridium sp. TaxID=1506 RepID=UPI001A402EC1|nr:site-specific integrase [Clostridium sp.]MBK5237209.1 site-specific integrase [Clostridium sp.]